MESLNYVLTDLVLYFCLAGYFGLISTPLFKEDGLILNPSAANAIVQPL